MYVYLFHFLSFFLVYYMYIFLILGLVSVAITHSQNLDEFDIWILAI